MLLPRVAFATLTTTLTFCPTSATVLPVPNLTPISSPSITTAKTGITFHQGLIIPDNTTGTCNAQIVAKGELTAGFCIGLHTYAISIAKIQGLECAFKLFKGSAACEADATDMTNFPVPSGEGDVCVVTGVEDGGKFVKGSGFLVCG